MELGVMDDCAHEAVDIDRQSFFPAIAVSRNHGFCFSSEASPPRPLSCTPVGSRKSFARRSSGFTRSMSCGDSGHGTACSGKLSFSSSPPNFFPGFRSISSCSDGSLSLDGSLKDSTSKQETCHIKSGVCRKLVDFMAVSMSSPPLSEGCSSVETPGLSQEFLSLGFTTSDGERQPSPSLSSSAGRGDLDIANSSEDRFQSHSPMWQSPGCSSNDQEATYDIPMTPKSTRRSLSLPSVAGFDALLHAPLIEYSPDTCVTPFGKSAARRVPKVTSMHSTFHSLPTQLSLPPLLSVQSPEKPCTNPSLSDSVLRDLADSDSDDDFFLSGAGTVKTILNTPISNGKRQHQESPMNGIQEGRDQYVKRYHSSPCLQPCDSKRTRGNSFGNQVFSPLRMSSVENITCMSSPKLNSALGVGCKQGDLIGDFSRPHRLPLLSSSGDLKRISCDTFHKLLKGEYTSVKRFTVVDCRYPYEYNGGHVKGAINLARKEDLIETLMSRKEFQEKPTVLVFHCEFSVKRSPDFLRFLRRQDRHQNGLRYPALRYPEMYLVDGGYSQFFSQHQEFCEPQRYVKMLDQAHTREFNLYQRSRSFSEGCEPEAKSNMQRYRTCLRF